jgi:hypothetical protein
MEIDDSPFGTDPSFSSTSSLYTGDMSAEMYYSIFYSASELNTNFYPYAFFPHSYDGLTHEKKGTGHGAKPDSRTAHRTQPAHIVARRAMVRLDTAGGCGIEKRCVTRTTRAAGVKEEGAHQA